MKRHWIGLIALAMLGLLFSLGGGWDATSSAQAQAPESEVIVVLPEVSGSYGDPQERFQIGILSGFSVTTVGGNPLFESEDGALAYTVVVQPIGEAGVAPLPEVELLRTAQSVFGEGEGFQTQGFQSVNGGLEIAWSGRFSQRGTTEPIQGSILAKQQNDAIYLLLVAATEAAADQIATAMTVLADSLTVL